MRPSPPEPYASRAWLLDGLISSVVGILQWTGERLEFIAFDVAMLTEAGLARLLNAFGQPPERAGAILAGEPDQLFAFGPSQISGYKFPWYQFKKALHLSAGEATLKISLIQPQNTKLPYKLVGIATSEYLAKLAIAQIPAESADASRWETICKCLCAATPQTEP